MTPIFDQVVTVRRTRPFLVLLTAVLVWFPSPPVLAQQASVPALSPTEQKIRDYIRAHGQEQVAFLEKAVNISSGTFNLPGVRAVGRLFEPEFAALGFQPNW